MKATPRKRSGTRPRALLESYTAWEPRADTFDFQWRLRLLQSHWRVERCLPIGSLRGRERGAVLAMPEAKDALLNYLTCRIRGVVRREVEDPVRSRGKLYGKPRIYNHLLSSQPLAFNLFGEMSENLDLASAVLCDMTDGRVTRVDAVEFEWSPGRGDPKYTGDRSAFDVYVCYRGSAGECGFLGIEVKYHENLKTTRNDYRCQYDEVAREMDCFDDAGLALLREPGSLQQMWRDHLLVGAHRKVNCFDEGTFVFLYPEVNDACSAAVADYRTCLKDRATFVAWTLDDFVACLRRHTEDDWVEAFYDRYLNLERLPAID